MAGQPIDGGASPANRFSPLAFFHQQVRANVRYWLSQLNARSDQEALPRAQRDNILTALRWALHLDDSREGTLELLLALHPYLRRRGIWAEWEAFLRAGLEISRNLGRPDYEAALLGQLGDLQWGRGERGAAIAAYEQAVHLARAQGDATVGAHLQAELGNLYRLQRRFAPAQQALEQALADHERFQDHTGQALSHYYLALLHTDQHRWNQAVAHHQQARRLWAEAGDRAGEARVQCDLGNLYFVQQDWVQAERCYRRAQDLSEQADSPLLQFMAVMNLGNLYMEQKIDGAEEYYQQALRIVQATDYALGVAQIHNNLGLVYARQQRWALAEEHFQRSIALSRQLNLPVHTARAEDNLAELYLQQHKWQAALEILNRAKGRLALLPRVGAVAAQLEDIENHLQIAQDVLEEAVDTNRGHAPL